MGEPCLCPAARAGRAPGGAARAGGWPPPSGPRLERDGHLVAAMGAHPDLASTRHLSTIFEPHRLVRPVDALPARHAFALIARRWRRIGLHWTRLSPLAVRIKLAKDSGWISADDDARRDVPEDDGVDADHRVAADPHAGQHRDLSADPDVVLDHDWLRRAGSAAIDRRF